MVSLREVQAANASLESTTSSLTAVFTGATSGIGKATLQSFAKHIPHPTAIIVGRSERAFASELQQLSSINPNGKYIFLEEDVSLIRNIDNVTKRITSILQERNSKVDLLFMSQGYVGFNGRENNADGLDNSFSLRYYGRLRFAQNLRPLLAQNARVLSILAGTQEGKLIEDDLDLEKNYSLGNSMNHLSTMTTLTWDALAAEPSSKDKSFLHIFPGLVSTGLLGRSATGALGFLFRWVVEPILSLVAARKPEEMGERMLFYATTSEFAKGSWALDWDGTAKENAVLKEYRERNFKDAVMEHNAKVFGRVSEGQ